MGRTHGESLQDILNQLDAAQAREGDAGMLAALLRRQSAHDRLQRQLADALPGWQASGARVNHLEDRTLVVCCPGNASAARVRLWQPALLTQCRSLADGEHDRSLAATLRGLQRVRIVVVPPGGD
jgi:hypothetical protein